MPKNRKSNKEAKKEPAMSLKEKRAARKSKHEESSVLGSADPRGKPSNPSAIKRP